LSTLVQSTMLGAIPTRPFFYVRIIHRSLMSWRGRVLVIVSCTTRNCGLHRSSFVRGDRSAVIVKVARHGSCGCPDVCTFWWKSSEKVIHKKDFIFL